MNLIFLLFQISYALSNVQCLSFDWDDNIFNMPSRIYVYKKSTHEEIDKTPLTGSIKEFESGSGKNYFLEHVEQAIKNHPDGSWQGPAWKAFVKSLSDPKTALCTSIITARSQTPEDILAGLNYLKSKKLLARVPLLKELHSVGKAKDTSAAKADVMLKQIDALEANSDPNALWGFSDDDYGNFSKAKEVLSKALEGGRYKKVKIALFFTGTNNPDHKPTCIILNQDGSFRPMTDEELKLTGSFLCAPKLSH